MAADHSSLLVLALVTIIIAFPLALTASPAEPALELGKRRAAVTHVEALRVENLHYDVSVCFFAEIFCSYSFTIYNTHEQ